MCPLQTEDAAIQLESMAFATRLPDSKYRPHDSLPLLDSAASPSTAGLAKSKGTNNADPQPVARELTAWGTSVVGHPLVYDGPWSGPALGLEMCFSLEELQMHYRRALDSIWPHMPDRALSQKLVAKYFDEVRISSRRKGTDAANELRRIDAQCFADRLAACGLSSRNFRGRARPRLGDDRQRQARRD
jgi:hypothetical protein